MLASDTDRIETTPLRTLQYTYRATTNICRIFYLLVSVSSKLVRAGSRDKRIYPERCPVGLLKEVYFGERGGARKVLSPGEFWELGAVRSGAALLCRVEGFIDILYLELLQLSC